VIGFALEFLLSFITGWARYILPYRMAMVAGGIGVVVGFSFAEKWFEELSPRRLVWMFCGVLGLLTSAAVIVAVMIQIELTQYSVQDIPKPLLQLLLLGL
jgi:hypothetical protein